jgi:hypothetical protein
MMFQGTFSTAFYRALARAIHLEVRDTHNQQGIETAWADVHALKLAESRLAGAVA